MFLLPLTPSMVGAKVLEELLSRCSAKEVASLFCNNYFCRRTRRRTSYLHTSIASSQILYQKLVSLLRDRFCPTSRLDEETERVGMSQEHTMLTTSWTPYLSLSTLSIIISRNNTAGKLKEASIFWHKVGKRLDVLLKGFFSPSRDVQRRDTNMRSADLSVENSSCYVID